MKFLSSFVVAVVLSGCSLVPKPGIETRYVLAPVQIQTSAMSTVIMPQKDLPVLGIARPRVPVDLRTNQLVLIQNGTLTFYEGKSWSAPLPDTLGAAMIRDLANNLPEWIVTGDNALKSQRDLQLEVHDFATIQNGSQATVIMNMDVRLVDATTRDVIKILPYRYSAPLTELNTAQTIEAYNKGWSNLIQEIVTIMKTTPLTKDEMKSGRTS
ncbi:MAG: hypothetical protein DI628_01780 [Blastochloris viridis]|uniref:ABC-type transport auxiliary lipoprotein component domain-containing protein n=1 Tax=Blastochloris viridis TaxID=1079 RepID=A0A6N4R3M1_BLAVI|nr:MAG: hypothetical protein DI628_01780 [Blastochloris viridis]